MVTIALHAGRCIELREDGDEAGGDGSAHGARTGPAGRFGTLVEGGGATNVSGVANS